MRLWSSYFNPRARWGRDRICRQYLSLWPQFQSTRRMGAAGSAQGVRQDGVLTDHDPVALVARILIVNPVPCAGEELVAVVFGSVPIVGHECIKRPVIFGVCIDGVAGEGVRRVIDQPACRQCRHVGRGHERVREREALGIEVLDHQQGEEKVRIGAVVDNAIPIEVQAASVICDEDDARVIVHAYFDRSFSEKFTQILEREYDSPVTRAGLWEDLYARHIRELEMYIRKYPGGIHEFDSLDELRTFDSAYVTNADSYIFDNICAVLHCTPDSIHGIIPIKTGLTNLSFKFTCNGRDYVYRHPGAGTEAYIDRPAEARALEVAKALGLDDTFLYIDAAKGWKISHYIEDAAILDYHNTEQVDTALRMLRRLHTSGIQLDGRFDIWEKINGFLDLLQGTDVSDFTGMQELHETICALHERLKGDAVPLCACHCDSYNPNFLIDKQGKMYLIDWEYAGMADPGCDIGTFIACSDYTPEEAEQVIARYLGHAPTGAELRHYIGYVAMASYFWFLWGLYQEACAKHVGEYLYIWYKYTKQYARLTLERYDHEEEFA